MTPPNKWDGKDRRALEPPARRFGPFVLDYTVTVPDLIAIIGAMVAIIFAFTALSSRLEVHDVQIKTHDKEIGELKASDANLRIEFLANIKGINDKLDRMVEREMRK